MQRRERGGRIQEGEVTERINKRQKLSACEDERIKRKPGQGHGRGRRREREWKRMEKRGRTGEKER